MTNIINLINTDSEIPKFKINADVIPYSVDYSWQELNCFYRPIATAFRTYNKDYFNMFLFWESFIRLYYCDNIMQNVDKIFFDFYEKNLVNIFNVKIDFIRICEKDNFHDVLINNQVASRKY